MFKLLKSSDKTVYGKEGHRFDKYIRDIPTVIGDVNKRSDIKDIIANDILDGLNFDNNGKYSDIHVEVRISQTNSYKTIGYKIIKED